MRLSEYIRQLRDDGENIITERKCVTTRYGANTSIGVYKFAHDNTPVMDYAKYFDAKFNNPF